MATQKLTMKTLQEIHGYSALKCMDSFKMKVSWNQIDQWITRYALPVVMQVFTFIQPWVEAQDPTAGAIIAFANACFAAIQSGNDLPSFPGS